MISAQYSAAIIFVVALMTILLRFLPFLVFQNKTPKTILYLGEVLPYSIMGMLVVYCLKGVNFLKGSRGIPEIISVIAVILIHKWRHNTLLSILLGTIIYMVLLQSKIIG